MARDFNGSTDRIDYPSAFDTTGQPITISMWVWFDDSAPAANEYLFNSASSGGGTGTILFQETGIDRSLVFFRLGSTAKTRGTGSAAFSTGTWTHVLATCDGVMTTGSSAHIYINGTVFDDASANGATETTANSGFQLGGRSSDDARNFDGRIAEVGVWNRVVSAGEIAALAKGFPPDHFPYLLEFHDPLIRAAGNRRGGAATLDGTTVIEHPRVIRRLRPLDARRSIAYVPPAEAAAPSLHVATTGMRW